jgi:hypothetical protein
MIALLAFDIREVGLEYYSWFGRLGSTFAGDYLYFGNLKATLYFKNLKFNLFIKYLL